MNQIQEITKGFWKENPVLVICLGLCPTLAVTNNVQNAIGMACPPSLSWRCPMC